MRLPVVVAVLLFGILSASAHAQTPPTTGGEMPYPAGWNLVAGYTGIGGTQTIASAAAGPLYTLQPGDTNYEMVPSTTPLQAGLGYWAYFAQPASIRFPQGELSPTPLQRALPAGQFVMIGDPFMTTATVTGVDIVYTYDPAHGYQATNTLNAGQGAWAFSQRGGPVTLSPPQSGASGDTAWAALGAVHPLSIERSTPIVGQSLTSEPSNPARLAYCDTGGIAVSSNAGSSWTGVSTAGVEDLASAAGYPLLVASAAPGACTSLLLDPRLPSSYYATFAAGKAPFGAPPIIFVGAYTTDSGNTWKIVPVPQGADLTGFGGFRAAGTTVEALFAVPAAGGRGQSSLAAETTSDGGVTWSGSSPACPATGPCVRWGPAPNQIGSCSMNERYQSVRYSDDGGRTWLAATLPGAGSAGANACNLNELVALSATDLLLIAEDAPLTEALVAHGSAIAYLSRDGGHNWAFVTMADLPGDRRDLIRGMQILPNGSLIALPQAATSWTLLGAGAASWCSIPSAALSASIPSADTVRVVGDRVWWLDFVSNGSGSGASTAVPHSASLTALKC